MNQATRLEWICFGTVRGGAKLL